jgi:hypothetical protein
MEGEERKSMLKRESGGGRKEKKNSIWNTGKKRKTEGKQVKKEEEKYFVR